MGSSAWQLQGDQALLQLDRFNGRVDLTRPSEGLLDFGHAGAALGSRGLLAIETPSCAGGDSSKLLVERHVRGASLSVSYRESSLWPVRVDALWRAATGPGLDRTAATIDLLISVWTDLMETRPQLTVRSTLWADEILHLVDLDSARFETLGPIRALRIEPSGGPGCLLFQPPDTDLSYAEMVHPADLLHDDLTGPEASRGLVSVRHRLFPGSLEKGVIRRGRVRGLLCPRTDDTRIAAACYAAFIAEEAPIG